MMINSVQIEHWILSVEIKETELTFSLHQPIKQIKFHTVETDAPGKKKKNNRKIKIYASLSKFLKS